MPYNLSIIVEGPGLDSQNRSHWALALHTPNSPLCTLLQVLVIDLNKLIYSFDKRSGADIQSKSSEGYFTIASLPPESYARAVHIISSEPAPNNGRDRCQDWVLNCVMALEIEEIIEAGTSEWLGGLVGQSAATVEGKAGARWVGNI